MLSPPALPQTLSPQATLDFTVQFQAVATGSYSAILTLPGISVVLTAAVIPKLTWKVPAPVNFGAVEDGSTAVIHITVENDTAQTLAVPPVAIRGDGFSLRAPSPAGVSLEPQQSAGFDILFTPTAALTYSGTLTAGDLTFTVAGTGIAPPLPKPLLSIDLPQPLSGRQGAVRVGLDAPARIAGSGTLTLAFQGPPDPTVAFASGGLTIPFTFGIGDTQTIAAQFQTGTTAGALIFTATLGGVTAQQTVVIAPAPVAISTAQASRGAGTITVQVTGFDNTRTAGPLAFTFFDRSGNAIPPAPITAAANFGAFFQSSGLGGLFVLNAVFPVNGDVSQIGAFEVQFTNAAGSSQTVRTNF